MKDHWYTSLSPEPEFKDEDDELYSLSPEELEVRIWEYETDLAEMQELTK